MIKVAGVAVGRGLAARCCPPPLAWHGIRRLAWSGLRALAGWRGA
jgi:hypothetical protein